MNDTEKLLKANSPSGTALLKVAEIPDPNFHPSATKLVRFANGKVIAMNRKLRRANHIYGVKKK